MRRHRQHGPGDNPSKCKWLGGSPSTRKRPSGGPSQGPNAVRVMIGGGFIHLLVEKIVGHSLGGGTAALLTFVLREQKEWSTACCVAFAPGWHDSDEISTPSWEIACCRSRECGIHTGCGDTSIHTKAEAANDQLIKELEERKELVNTLFMKHHSEKQGTKKTYKRKLHVYKKENVRMVESRRK
ncbi:hypothetical protein AgCh_012358 [Apium graveolens]